MKSDAAALITDAYRDRIGWYGRYGFEPIHGAIENGPQRMFLDMRTLRAAVARVNTANLKTGSRV